MADIKEKTDKYERFLISEADLPEPPAGLDGKIMRRVRGYERRVLIAKTVGFGALLSASIGAVVVAYLNLTAALTQSGFLQFISLFFSDFNVAMANFQDLTFSILESFPVFSAAFLVAGLIVVIWSAMHFVDDVSQVRTHRGLVAG